MCPSLYQFEHCNSLTTRILSPTTLPFILSSSIQSNYSANLAMVKLYKILIMVEGAVSKLRTNKYLLIPKLSWTMSRKIIQIIKLGTSNDVGWVVGNRKPVARVGTRLEIVLETSASPRLSSGIARSACVSCICDFLLISGLSDDIEENANTRHCRRVKKV